MFHLTKHFHHISKSGLLLVMLIGGFLLPGMTIPAFADSPPMHGSVTSGSLSETATGTYTFTGNSRKYCNVHDAIHK